MPDNKIDVKIGATNETGPGLEGAKSDIDDFSDHAENQFQKVGEAITAAFAVEKVLEFSKEAIADFAEVERQFDILGAAVERSGGKWEKSKEGVENFLERARDLSGFSKDELLKSLNDSITKTGDLAASTSIVDKAMRLALESVGDLKGNVDALSNAYQGNNFGLRSLGRELGLTTDQAKNSNAVFAKLEERIKGIDSVAKDTQGNINQWKSAWAESFETAGRTLGGLVNLASKDVDALKYFSDVLETENGDYTIFHRAELEKQTKDIKQATDEQLAAHAASANTQKEMDKAFQDAQAQNAADAEKAEKRIEEAHKHTIEIQRELDKEYDEDLRRQIVEEEKARLKANEEITKSTSTLTKSLIQAAKDGKDAGKELAQALLKFAADGIAKQLEAESAAYTAKAIGDAASYNEEGAAMDAAAAADYAAYAGVVEAIGSVALAEGGVVTGPTHALIGEAGPEAVIPLSQAGGYGLGSTSIGAIHLNLPSVRNPNDFKDAGVQQSIARQMAAQLQDTNSRQGNRFAGASQ